MNTPIDTIRALRSENENRLILTVNWEDYLRYSMKLDNSQPPVAITKIGY